MKHRSARLRFRRRAQCRAMLRVSAHRSVDICIALCRMVQPAPVPVYDLAEVTAAQWVRSLDARVLAALYEVPDDSPFELLAAASSLNVRTRIDVMTRLGKRDREALPPLGFA